MSATPYRPYRPCTDHSPCRFLLIEDDPSLAYLFLMQTKVKGDGGFECEVAASMAEAEEKLCACSYDLIWLDLNLPDSTGIDTLDRTCAASGGAIPIIILTGQIVDSEAQLLEHGATEIVSKVNQDYRTLLQLTRTAIARARLRNQRLEENRMLRERIAELEGIRDGLHEDSDTDKLLDDLIGNIKSYANRLP